jgi:hypothetical protein
MKLSNVLLWVVVLSLVGWLVLNSVQTNQSLGSSTVGNEYYATSTPVYGSWTDQLIRRGWGSLGSVIITGAGNTHFILYDATSTDAVTNSFWGASSKSNQQLANFPASVAAGTYVLDVVYTDGLVIDVVSGNTGTSTITYR